MIDMLKSLITLIILLYRSLLYYVKESNMDKSRRNLKNVQALYTLEELNKLKEKIAKPKKSLQSNTSNVLLKNGSKKASTNLSATPGIKSYFSSTDTQRQSSKKNANTTPAATKVQKKPRPLAEETPRIVAQPTPTNAASSQRDPPGIVVFEF